LPLIEIVPEACGARLAAKWLKKGNQKALHFCISVLRRFDTGQQCSLHHAKVSSRCRF
jgi:hypothetical protein